MSKMWRFLQQDDCVFADTLGDLQDLRRRYTVNGAPTMSQSPFGQALTLDGSNDWIDIPHRTIDFEGELSICCWINSVNESSFRRIVSCSAAADPRWILYLDSNGKLILYVDDNINTRTLISSTSAYDDESWYSAVATFKSGEQKLYIGDSEVDSDTKTIDTFTPTNNLEIGSYDNGTNKWNGQLRNLIIYKRVLTETEVSNIYYNRSF